MDERISLIRDELRENTIPYGAVLNHNNNNTKPRRVVALDVFRGFLMVLQSLDHARIFLANDKSQAEHETWYFQPVYRDLIPSLARLATHLAAQVMLFATTVLFALGVNFIIGGLVFLAGIKSFPYLLKLNSNNDNYGIAEKKAKYIRNIVLLILIILLAVGNILQTPKPEDYGKVDFDWWRYIWLLPAMVKNFFSIYPPLNWLSFTIYGILYGHITLKQAYNERYNRNLNLKIGIFLLILFLTVRIPGKFGNINPDLLPSPPPGTLFNNPYLTSPLQFVNAIKYPPDLSFITLYMGLNHLVLAFFYSINSLTSYSTLNYFMDFINNGPLLAFGQSALFFYMMHFHIYYFMELIFKFLFGYNQETLYNINYWQFWSLWIFGLGLLWPMCIKYARFKSKKDPDSLWRFF